VKTRQIKVNSKNVVMDGEMSSGEQRILRAV